MRPAPRSAKEWVSEYSIHRGALRGIPVPPNTGLVMGKAAHGKVAECSSLAQRNVEFVRDQARQD